MVKYISDQMMVMNEGEIVEIANSDEIYRHPQRAVHAAAAGVDPEGLARRAAARRGLLTFRSGAAAVAVPDAERA